MKGLTETVRKLQLIQALRKILGACWKLLRTISRVSRKPIVIWSIFCLIIAYVLGGLLAFPSTYHGDKDHDVIFKTNDNWQIEFKGEAAKLEMSACKVFVLRSPSGDPIQGLDVEKSYDWNCDYKYASGPDSIQGSTSWKVEAGNDLTIHFSSETPFTVKETPQTDYLILVLALIFLGIPFIWASGIYIVKS